LALEVAAGFLDEPEAHDVFQEADLTRAGALADALLVGVVEHQSLRVDDGVGGLDAHEGPGAGGQIAPGLVVGGEGDCGDGAGCVVAAGGDDGGVGAEAGFFGEVWEEGADVGAGGDDLAEEVVGDSEGVEELFIPRARVGVEHLTCGGDGELVRHCAGEEVVEEVGHEEEVGCAGEEVGVLLLEGVELEERVELHELDAGGSEDLVAGEFGEDFFEVAIGAGVAVVDGVCEELAAVVEEAEVDAPGVDADAVEGLALELAGGGAEAGLDVLPEGQQVPLEGALKAAVVGGEAVELMEG
jgi:hypothetical protein